MIFIKTLRQTKIVFDDVIADKPSNKNLNPIVMNYLLEVESLTLLLFLLRNPILLYRKILD